MKHIVPLIITLTTTGAACAQAGRLAEDLEDLQIRHHTTHYDIAGTVSDDRLQELGRCLEYIYTEYAKGFSGIFDKMDTTTAKHSAARSRVIIFAEPAEYDRFSRTYFSGTPEFTVGQYVGAVDLLMIKNQDNIEDIYETLFHEAFHQFIRRYIAHPPMWLNEGLATYYGSARPTRNGLTFDRPQRDFYWVMKRAIDAHKVIPFDQLMGYDRAQFYDPSPISLAGHDVRTQQLCYAQAYTMIAFIIQDPTGPEHLRQYILKLSAAADIEQARAITRELFPPEILEAMVPGWVNSVQRR